MGIAILIVAFDQLTKWAVIKWVQLYAQEPVNGFLNITHLHNYGAAWSFLADQAGWQRWALSILAVAVSVYLVIWLWRLRGSKNMVLPIGLALVLGGAVGNVIDRIRLGYVEDFIQVMFGSWAFPAFNVADSAISVGAVLLIIDTFFISGRAGPAKSESG
jgi:signal peptidase II